MRRRLGSVKQYRDRDGWYCRWRIGGKEINRHAGKTKSAAQARLAKVWSLVQDEVALQDAIAYVWGEPPPGVVRQPFVQLLDLYLVSMEEEKTKRRSTVETDRFRAVALRDAAWGKMETGEFGKPEVLAWITKRLAAGVAGSTINSDLSLASAVVRFSHDRGLIAEDGWNPFLGCRLRRVVKQKRVGMGLAAFLHFLEKTNELAADAHALFLAGGVTGWRLGDFQALRWADVHLDAERPYMEALEQTEKTGKLKRAYLPPKLVEALTDTKRTGNVKRLDSAPVFRTGSGTVWDSQAVRRRLKRVLEACDDKVIPPWMKWGDPDRGIKKFDFHSLKHTARTVLRELGHDVFSVNAQVGHSTMNMASLYTHVHDAELARMAETIGHAMESKGVREGEQASKG